MPTDNLNTASAISPEKLDSTEDQSPKPWAVPMAKPAGGFQPEATPLTFEPRPREVNKILNSKHVIEGMDLTDPDDAAVFVANFLSSKHNADKNEIYNDYELNTQVYGLSGTDSVADAKAILDGDTRTHQKSENRIAKKPKEEVGSLAYAASQPVVVFEGMGKGGLSMAGGLFSQAADYSRKAGVALETTPEEKEQILQLQKDWIELSKPEREQAKLAGVSGTVRGGGKREIRPFEIASPMGTRKDSTLGKEEFQRQDDRKALQARADAIQSGIISRHEKTFLGEFSGEASAASDWLRDARETYGEYDLIPAGAREGLVGEFSNVLGTSMPIMASMMASGGAGLFLSQSQMYENMRDSERAFAESQGEEFDPTKDLFSRGGAATAMAMIERLMGVEKMLSNALKTTGKKSVTNLTVREAVTRGAKTGLISGIAEAPEEMTQGVIEDFRRALTFDVDYDMSVPAFVERRGHEALLAIMSGGLVGTTTGVAVELDNRKALDKFMNPVNGMSAVDMALAYNVIPEPEFNIYIEEQFGDQTTEEGVPLQELAKKARQGDRKAAEELVAATTVEASQAAVEAGLTPEESEARGKEAAEVADPIEPLAETAVEEQINLKKQELAALEEAEDSTPEDMKKYEKLDKEIQALETKRVEEIVKGKIMTPFTRGIEAEQKRVEQARLDKADKDLEQQDQVIDLVNRFIPLSKGTTVKNTPALAAGGPAIIQGWKDAGFSKKEIAAKSKELMTQQGRPNDRLEDQVQKGSQKSTVVDGAVRSVVKLFQGANPFTVVEEFAHAEYDREIAEGTVTVEQVREWRKAVEELTDTPDLRGETDEDIKEWVAEQVKARIYGQRNNLSLPESFLKFLDDIISGFKQILGRAKELQDLEASGQLPTDFLEMLDRQGLVGKPVGTPSTQANAGISEQENIDRVETFSLEHTDPALGYTYSYDKDSDKFKQLVKDGYITTNKTLEDFDGEIIFLHQPDGAFSGQLKHGDEVLVEGQGGVFYPIKFHEGGYFWASTDNAAKKMAADLNKVYKQNNGKIYMALTSAPVEKLLSSTTMANAVMDFFSVKASDPKVKLPEKEVQGAIIEAANASKVQDVYNPDTGKTKSVRVSLGLNLDPNDSYAENVEKIKAMLAPDKSSFDARKLFSVNIAISMAEQIEASPDAKEMLGSFFSTGLNNKYSKIKRGKDGDLSKMSGAGMVQALSDMLSEPLTKPFQQRANQGGYVYAVLEINSKVKPVKAVGMHTSYPMAIQSVDDSKATVHILQQAPHWSTVFEDPKTGKIVKKNRLKSVYPSSGVSTTGVKANTSENPRYTISPVSAEADVKYVKWLELSSMEGTDEEIIAAGEAAVNAGGTTKTFQKWVSNGDVKKIQAAAMSLAKSKMKTTAKSMGYTLNKEENVFEGYGKTKSADITYNADGTPITLSDRFDDTNVDESYSLEVEESMKDVTKRTPEVVEAAAQYGAGKITLDEYNEIVAKADPIKPFTEVPAAATEEEIIGALKKDKVPFVGTENFTRTLSSGDRVGARLDIPAYKDHGVWVASVHEPRSGVSSGGAGAKIGYVPTVRLSNVNFATNPFVAFRIATGQTTKTTIATVEGDWVDQSDGMSEAEAKDVLNDPSWVQVGMNPFRHSYFYDRSSNTGAPVVSAEEVIQVGGLVLAKNPVYAPKNDPRFKIMQGKIKPAALEKAGVSDLDATFSLEKSPTSLRLKMTRKQIIESIEGSKDWKDFYTRSKELMVEYFGADAPLFERLLSATSQAASVKANVSLALKAYGQLKRGDKFTGYLPAVIGNLNKISKNEKLSGRKISNYENANAGDVTKVVVDRHVARMLFGTKSPTPKQFSKAEKVLTEVANDIGWEPRQVQAAIWAASIRKNNLEPESYDGYLKRLKREGTLEQKVGFSFLERSAENIGSGDGRPDTRQSAREAFSLEAPDTPAFKSWFGDSKVVDENGEPMVVYHRTSAAFDQFIISAESPSGAAAFFGDDPSNLPQFHNRKNQGDSTIPVFLNISEPLEVDDFNAQEMRDRWANGDSQFPLLMSQDASDNLKKAGFDGVIYENAFGGETTTEYLVLDPTQIKSATGNRGTFDPNDPRINYSLEAPDTPAFKSWFGDSKVVDKNGEPIVVKHGTSGLKGGAFLKELLGSNTGSPSAFKGFFFSDSQRLGDYYNRSATAQAQYDQALKEETEFNEEVNEILRKRDKLIKSLEPLPPFRDGLAEKIWKMYQFSGTEALEMIEGVWGKTPELMELHDQLREMEGNQKARFKSIDMMQASFEGEEAVEKAFDLSGETLDVYLSIQNPLEVDHEGNRKGRSYSDLIDKAISEGRDGVIIRNSVDPLPATIYIAFEPNQIKSATGNNGNFDLLDPRINYSLEPLSEQDADAEATVAAEERQSRTPERQAFIDYQRELRRTQLDNTEEEKEKLQKLLQLATDADEIAELKQAGDEKIIRVVEQKVKQIRKQAAEREDVTESVKALERLINSPEVPMEVRARMRGYGRLAERKTPQGKARWVEQMANKLEAEIDRHYRTRNVRALRSFLRPFATQYAPNRRKVRELKGEDARFELEFAQRLLNNSEATPPVGMKDARRDELIDIFGDVGNRQSSPTRVAAALEIARGISGDGRKVREEFEQDRRERNAAIGGKVVAQVLNTEDALDDTSITANERDQWGITKAFKSVASLMIRGMEGFQQQLNKLDRIKGGVLETMFLSAAHNAHQTELAMNIEHAEQTRDDFATVLGPDNRVAAKWYKGSHEVHQTDIEWINNKKVGMVKRKLSKQQGVSLLMQWLDPSLRPTFANMGINEATIEQVKEFIGEIGVSEAYYFREKYAEMGIKLNAKHMEIEGIPLDMIDGYGGRARRQGAKTKEEDMQMFARNSAGRPTVKSGSMKERTNSTDYLMFMDADLAFTTHAQEVNHYISHAELARNLTAAFLTNEDARNAIKQKHGSKFYKSLADQVETIIAGRPTLTDTQKFWTKGRALLTKGTLMVKPAIMFKQLTSAPAFIEEIGPVAYSKAGTAMMKPENLAKFLPMIWGSEYVKNRRSTSQYADIQQSLDARQNVMKGMRLSDWVMMNVKIGDIGAVIMGGAPVYYHAYTEAKAEGMTDDQAQAKAEEVFGLASERAQQSSAGHAQGSFLKGQGLARSWFMYQTSPLQYQRNVNTSIANFVAQAYELKNKRPSEAKKAAIQAVRAISIYHFILPQIFQAVASGLVGFTDDEDYIKEKFWARQRRAAYLGNLNTFPALGTLLSGLANIISGADETFRSSGSPIIDIFTKTAGQFNKAVKNGDDMDAWIDLGSELAQARGIPVKTVRSYYEAITDVSEGNTRNPLLRLLGWSKWSLFED